jgi:hypothetical protein
VEFAPEPLPEVVPGEWGMVAYIAPQDTSLVLYDDDDLGDFDQEQAVIYPREFPDGGYFMEDHRNLRGVPGFEPAWLSNGPAPSLIYAVLPVPLLDMNRVKVGITTRLPDRIKQFRTSCPHALLVGLWPGDKRAEERAHRVISGVRMGTSEVFQCVNVWDSLARIHKELAP